MLEIGGVAPLIADCPHVNSSTDTDTHPISDMCDITIFGWIDK